MKRIEKWPGLRRSAAFEIAKVERAEGGGENDAALYEIAISSEYPVRRWMGLEVLGHKRGEIDLSRLTDKAALLLNHDPDRQIGVVEKAWVDSEEKRLRGHIRFSRSALGQEIERDVNDGIRRQISVGYSVEKVRMEKSETTEGGDTVETYRVVRWQPYEVSVVSVAADPTVGIGRGETGSGEFPVEVEDGRTVEEDRKVNEQERQEKEAREAADRAAREAAASAVSTREKEIGEIVRLYTAHGFPDKAQSALERGVTLDQAKDEVLELKRTFGPAVVPPRKDVAVDLPEKDKKRYSYKRAIAALVDQAEGRGRFDGVEREVHDEIEKGLPDGVKRHGGVFIPYALGLPAAQRAYPLSSATATEGQEAIFTQQGEFIELLRNRLTVAQMGARMLTGLVGPVTFPRQTGAATGVWYVEEAAAISDSMLALDTTTLSPKMLMATTGYTRQLLAQESVGVELLVREDLAAVHAIAIDAAALIGSGSGGPPKGVAYQSGVGTKDFGPGANANAAPTYANLIACQGIVADANADRGALGYITTPLVAATLKSTLEFSAAGGAAVWQGTFENGMVGGYRAMASNNVGKVWLNGVPTGGTEHGLLYGNWNELLVGMWNAMEIVVDPYTLKKRAIIELTSYQMVDTTVRHPASFVIGQNIIP